MEQMSTTHQDFRYPGASIKELDDVPNKGLHA